MAQKLKNLSAIWETQVWSLGREDPLEEGMATHSSTLAWRIPWTEEPRKLQSMRLQRVGHDKRKINTYILHTTFLVEKFWKYHFCIKKKISSSSLLPMVPNGFCSGFSLGHDLTYNSRSWPFLYSYKTQAPNYTTFSDTAEKQNFQLT